MIIYPPLIADTIPAFTKDKIIIPFSQNPAVGVDEVKGFKLIVKRYTDSEIITTLSVAVDKSLYDSNTKFWEVAFETTNSSWIPNPKEYYKFQISYDDGTEYFAYSSASIGRCIEKPTVWIKDLTGGEKVNKNLFEYIGQYETTTSSEPVYSYQFIFYDDNNKVIQDTGKILHNVDKDNVGNDKRFSTHVFRLYCDLKDDIIYTLKYIVTSINNYTTSLEYKIVKETEGDIDSSMMLQAFQSVFDKDNGCISVQVTKNTNIDASGKYMIQRTEDGVKWEEIVKFDFSETLDTDFIIWKDYSVKQGTQYVYSIQKYINEKWSQRKTTDSITPDFEDIFLTDGKRQLKIKYNPKVSSFKNVILEQKTDTIGGKYPFIFKNNSVNYKEIPISGLISYLSDNDGLFINNDSQEEFDTSLSSNNVTKEREFKLEVLDWLNNGKPKIFRSPTEGNYVVRIMNVSLSPETAIGRMLHSFTATAYEIMDNNFDNLVKNNLIDFSSLQDHVMSSTLGSFMLDVCVLGGGNQL